MLEEVKTRFRYSLPTHLKSIKGLNRAICIDNQIIGPTITDQAAPDFTPENCFYHFFEAKHSHGRIVFINPLVEDGNEIVGNRGLAILSIELLFHIMSGVGKEEVHTRNSE